MRTCRCAATCNGCRSGAISSLATTRSKRRRSRPIFRFARAVMPSPVRQPFRTEAAQSTVNVCRPPQSGAEDLKVSPGNEHFGRCPCLLHGATCAGASERPTGGQMTWKAVCFASALLLAPLALAANTFVGPVNGPGVHGVGASQPLNVDDEPPPPLDMEGLKRRLAEKGLALGSPIMIRVFKDESELELWVQKEDRFELFAVYRICNWSGALGPKLTEGNRQSPEGFYSIGSRQLHRTGRWRRSLDVGFPNTFDKAHGRTGS